MKDLTSTIARLKMLYAGQGEDRVFARMLLTLPASMRTRLEERAAQIPEDGIPAPDALFPLWEDTLRFTNAVEDDWVPSIYPRPYDQGIYGTLFGATMEMNRVGPPGVLSSATRPLEGKTYDELVRLAAEPREDGLQRMEKDLREFAVLCRARWGVAVTITIDGFNLCQQIGGMQFLWDLYDRPKELKRFLEAGVELNIKVVERQRAAIGMTCEGGVYDFFNAGWLPDHGIPMSVDCYNMCSAEVYAEFGRPYQQRLLDYFGAGNFHVHGNGRHLLPEIAKLKGCIVADIANDGSNVTATDDVASIKKTLGDVIPLVTCHKDRFEQMLRDQSLVGGVYYRVGPCDTADEANRLMERVRRYRC